LRRNRFRLEERELLVFHFFCEAMAAKRR